MILDTNALWAYADGGASIVDVVDHAESIELPVIVLGEYRYGIAQSRNKREYEEWLLAFLAKIRVLTVTEETTHAYARIRGELRRAGTPIPTNDVWIAALSREHGLQVLSRDRLFDVVRKLERITW